MDTFQLCFFHTGYTTSVSVLFNFELPFSISPFLLLCPDRVEVQLVPGTMLLSRRKPLHRHKTELAVMREKTSTFVLYCLCGDQLMEDCHLLPCYVVTPFCVSYDTFTQNLCLNSWLPIPVKRKEFCIYPGSLII